MVLRYVSIVKARAGEFDALSHCDAKTARKLLPLFEVAPLTDKARESKKYLANSSEPLTAYLNRTLTRIFDSWGDRPAMIDGYLWSADTIVESGEHAIAYMVRALDEAGANVIPVIGYDRWENQVYRTGLKGLNLSARAECCVRLDSHAIDDALEPEFFVETIENILAEFDLSPEKCSVLIDFGDASSRGVDDLISSGSAIIGLLQDLGFKQFVTAACSIPKSIDLAVKAVDSTAMIIRREAIVWKALSEEFPAIRVIYGDYAVRGPASNDEVQSKYTNGKIRHTTGQQFFVVRGHAFFFDHSAVQMHALAAKIVESPYYLGPNFSWGDRRIYECSKEKFMGSPANWIAIDTSHHIEFVVQEVEEFVLSTV
jgi:hypothetical protein